MKYRFSLILMILLGGKIYAQTAMIPSYELSDYDIAMDMMSESLGLYAQDEGHLLCNSVMYYELHGMAPSTEHRWVSLTGGTQDASSVNTPPAVLCRLLSVYANPDADQLKALYRPEDASFIDDFFAKESYATAWHSTVENVNRIDILLSYTVQDLTVLYAELYHDNEALSQTPFMFQVKSGVWYLASATDNSALTTNLSMYLYYYNASSMISSNDMDGDGIPNFEDNCPCHANPDQRDLDGDGIGDVCDNCPTYYNKDQADSDRDGVGNVCDNCITTPNPDQEDTDNDGIGDACDYCPYDFDPSNNYTYDANDSIVGVACDPDIDGDGILNEEDDDMDGDGWPNEMDNCPRIFNPNQADSDHDGVGDVCDNCPLNYNPGQEDSDHDGQGDVCDADQDGDGIPDDWDNCPYHYNPEQEDEDCNGIGDVCETDKDGDGIDDLDDNCPDIYNPDQTDSDGDGIGDACDDNL